jgi:hypothetical protein
MSGNQVDMLCRDWLQENYGSEIASEYRAYSLLAPMWNSIGLNDALECLKLKLSLSFGSDQSFASTDYHEARKLLGLSYDSTPVPDVFKRAFVSSLGHRLY